MHQVRRPDADRQFDRGPAAGGPPPDSRALWIVAGTTTADATAQTATRSPPATTVPTARSPTCPGHRVGRQRSDKPVARSWTPPRAGPGISGRIPKRGRNLAAGGTVRLNATAGAVWLMFRPAIVCHSWKVGAGKCVGALRIHGRTLMLRARLRARTVPPRASWDSCLPQTVHIASRTCIAGYFKSYAPDAGPAEILVRKNPKMLDSGPPLNEDKRISAMLWSQVPCSGVKGRY